MTLPPIALFIFNRPECLEQVLAPVRRARAPRLFLVADGPRPGNRQDPERCASARRVAERAIDWPCEVTRLFADANLGCAQRVSSGLDWVFSQVDEAIILEDDCVADDSFFPFCAELLGRYRDDPRVAQIGGTSFQAQRPAGAASYFLSRYPHCWGWATWRRSWRHYDHAMHAWTGPGGAKWLDEVVDNPAERAMWRRCFAATSAGTVDSWAYRWTAAVWHQHALTALPYANLVENIGFGPAATHTTRRSSLAGRPLQQVTFPLMHPLAVVRDEEADEYTSRTVFRPASLLARASRRLKAMLRR